MRRPAARKSRARTARPYSVPAPTRGWNARDSLATMRPGDAVKLVNFWPTQSDVMLRMGSATSVTGAPAPIETLVSYKPANGTSSLWGVAGTAVYNVSNPGPIPAASVTGLTNARWEFVNVTTSAGSFLVGVNGVDKPLMYNGTTWTPLDGASTPTLTGSGLSSSSVLTNIAVAKNRVWYIESNSFRVWYSAVGAFAGTLTALDLSTLFNKGGYLVAQGNWTLDGGRGMEDLTVFITSEGEVAVYQGIDPSGASTWNLVGVYQTGLPVGKRCFTTLKGDLLILTTDGLAGASKALVDDQAHSVGTALSERISGALQDATTAYGANTGWQVVQFSPGGALILNVPVGAGVQEQYVMNTTTGAWARFTGWPASCFAVHNKRLYFGGPTGVVQAWIGTADDGRLIIGELVGAYDYFKNKDGIKEITMFRPVIGWNAQPAQFLVGVNCDFVDTAPTGAIAFPGVSGGIWDSSKWDMATWAGTVTLNASWYTVFGVGFAIAPHLIISSSSAQVRIAAFDYYFKTGIGI